MATAHPALQAFLAARDDRSPRPAAEAGGALCLALSERLDAALAALFAAAGAPEGVALVAVGGYGRREQARHSDIDVMVLVANGDGREAARILYPLWDAGLKVGHSVRTPSEAAAAGRDNVETLTALLDARLVAGDAALFERFARERRALARRSLGTLEAALAERRGERAARQRWQAQEPDLKNGRGALRDVQSLRWLDAALALPRGEEPPAPPTRLVEAHERLLASRNAVHAHVDRPSDVYRNDLAPRVATWLGVDSIAWRRELFLAMREVDAAAEARLGAAAARRGLRHAIGGWLPGRRAPSVDTQPRGGSSPPRDLDRLRDALGVTAGRGDQSPPLEPFPRAEWLTRLLPEWEVLRGRPHIAPFHIHPVDAHAMRTVEEAAHVLSEGDEHAPVEVAAAHLDRDEVLLGALLHDIGKGHEGDHSSVGAVIAERFATRAGLEAAQAQRLATVVRRHLMLPSVATRRDIADERVIRDVAEQAGDVQTLHLLYVLAVADARATGPGVWTSWRAQLIRSLYERVLALLEAEAPGAASVPEQRLARVVARLAGRFPAEAVEAHVRQLEPSYLLSTPPETISDHLELIEAARAEPEAGAVRLDRLNGLDRLTVVTRDRPGVIQAVAGAFACHGANVLGGVAYTREDGVAIEVWHVDDAIRRPTGGGDGREGGGIEERRWARLLEAVPAALRGEFPLEERIAEMRATYGAGDLARRRLDLPTTVHVDNAASDRYSVLEVGTADRLGLLYAITRALRDLQLDVHLAKVDTIGPEVVDAFYVRREHGRRLEEPDEIARVEARVREAVLALDAPGSGGEG